MRQATGLGLREAAREAGVFASQLSEWENGKKQPSRPTLERLANFYGNRLGRRISLDQVADREPFLREVAV
jgi:transcriptional regulator with XRE-family HTH domain